MRGREGARAGGGGSATRSYTLFMGVFVKRTTEPEVGASQSPISITIINLNLNNNTTTQTPNGQWPMDLGNGWAPRIASQSAVPRTRLTSSHQLFRSSMPLRVLVSVSRTGEPPLNHLSIIYPMTDRCRWLAASFHGPLRMLMYFTSTQVQIYVIFLLMLKRRVQLPYPFVE